MIEIKQHGNSVMMLAFGICCSAGVSRMPFDLGQVNKKGFTYSTSMHECIYQLPQKSNMKHKNRTFVHAMTVNFL